MIIGVVCDFVLNKPLEEWIDNKLDSVIQRGVDKDAIFMILSNSGWDMSKKMNGVKHFVVTHWGGYQSSSAIVTFNADIKFFIDMSDLIVIVSNENVHTVWDEIRVSDVTRIEINYLSKKEKKYERVV